MMRLCFLHLLPSCAVLLLVACGGPKPLVPEGTTQPDRFLFTRGNEELEKENWVDARTYFQRIVDGYPQSTLRTDSKLAIGDSYLGEDTTESVILAANEFREFLSFYPTNARADYAQYKLAMSHYNRMRSPDRDQTETRRAVQEFDVFFERYPNSSLVPEVREKAREAKDRLTEADYSVGVFYFKTKWYPGAIARFRDVLATDPEFSSKDGVYYYLAESLARTDKIAEAIPYFERLIAEFSDSEFRSDGIERLESLQAQ